MDNYTIFLKFENPRKGRQARNLSENDPKILDLKSSSEQIIFRKLSLGAPVQTEKTKGISTMIVVWICGPFSILSSFTIHEKDK